MACPDFTRGTNQIAMDFDGARFLHKTVGMKRTGAVRVVMVLLTVVATGCQESRTVNPAAASLFIPSVQGIWSGPMTLVATSGGECVVGSVIPTFLPTLDVGTFTLSQNADTLNATITMESTGLACRIQEPRRVECRSERHLLRSDSLVVTCANGVPRELKFLGSSVTASWNGSQIAGRTTSTYNVLDTSEWFGVGSLVADTRIQRHTPVSACYRWSPSYGSLRMTAFRFVSLVPCLVLLTATVAGAQQARVASSGPFENRVHDRLRGRLFQRSRAATFGIEIGETINSRVQAYAAFHYFDDLFNNQAASDLNELSGYLTSVTGDVVGASGA